MECVGKNYVQRQVGQVDWNGFEWSGMKWSVMVRYYFSVLKNKKHNLGKNINSRVS